MHVEIPSDLAGFARACVERGRFDDVSEVMRYGLRLVQEAEERREAFVASLEAAHAAGQRDGFLTIDEVEAELREVIRVATPTTK